VAANCGKHDIDGNCHVIGPIAQIGQQAGIAHDHVEFVAVQHEILLAVGGLMNDAFGHLYAAEMRAGKATQEFVMIAGNVDDP